MAIIGTKYRIQENRLPSGYSRRFLTTCLITFYGFSILLLSSSAAHDAIGPTNLTRPQNERTCKSVDIRNTLETFQRLKGCRVVEGFVQILLFDSVNETSLSNISFPELTEITEFLVLFRVHGLRSIGQLFPNLAVIRGQELFFDYAFVVYEMSSLQEIGLYSLTNITRGLVRIDKNPSLCFVNSIEWDHIIQQNDEKGLSTFIKTFKPDNECPICMKEGSLFDADGRSIKTQCPMATKSSYGDLQLQEYMCWNKKHCMKRCPRNCTACNIKGECCNPNCLGGCSIDNIDQCTVCKNFTMGEGPGRTCMNNCPEGYFEYLGRRCITMSDCKNMTRPIRLHPTNEEDDRYKIFKNKCVLTCPTNFMSNNESVCIPCQGKCKKTCQGVNVDNISVAKQLRGCTTIDGDLEIQIRGGRNVVSELEEYLSMIEEITGYLKVVRSFPLVSLNFLKSLTRIRGDHLENQKYVLVILDNQNLQDLWDWDNRKNKTFRIDKGRLFFHFNPKLCKEKIDILQSKINISKYTDLEVALNSNGDKIACSLEDLHVHARNNNGGVVLEWQQFKIDDQRKLLGYTVYHIEAKYQNVTLYDGRDACGGDDWHVDDVPVPETDQMNVTHPLTQVNAYTQYAYYVKTYTIATEQKGAQSKIEYITTAPGVPSSPRIKELDPTSSSLKITWHPPSNPKGNVTHYIISGQKQVDTNTEENYCAEYSEYIGRSSLQNSNKPPLNPYLSNNNNATSNADTCQCMDGKKKSKINEFEQASRIKFENELQNEVYIKRASVNRKKRNIADTFPYDTNTKQEKTNKDIINVTKIMNGTNIRESFSFIVYGKTEFLIDQLQHFTTYIIYIQACREREYYVNDTGENCSSSEIYSAKTRQREGANDIKHILVKNQNITSVTLTWDEPPFPNGIISAYELELRKIDMDQGSPSKQCIPRNKYLNESRLWTIKLHPGNYTVRVRALTSDKGGEGKFAAVNVYIAEPNQYTLTIVFSLIIILVVIFGIILFWFYRKQQRNKKNLRLITDINPDYVPTDYIPDDWEVPRKNIDLIKELGQGSFGMVWEGLAREIKGKAQMRCAIKTVNEHATNRERIEFLNEASVMKAFDTAHVVRLLGVVSQGQPTLVIMELMVNGDLKTYLRSHRPTADTYNPNISLQPPSLKQILQMAIEIADGMAYLAAKKFVHRDLAARNCMVSEDLTVKIGDFGMTRDVYENDYYRKDTKGLLPVRWMAPESLRDGVFASSSDIWSYGVVLWEMATLASQPYQGLTNDQVLRYVIDGGVMERPENCPDKLYKLMKKCWNPIANMRPTFLKLCSYLLEDANSEFSRVSFYHSAAGIEARTSRPTPSPSQDDPSTPLRGVVELEQNFSLGNSDDSDGEMHIEAQPHINYRSTEGSSNTANGFVRGPTNGAATTQC